MEVISKLLIWDEAKQYDVDEVSYVIAPVKHDAKPFTNKNYEAAKFMVFYLDKADSMQMKVIEILGAAGTSLGNNIPEIASTAFTNMYINKNKSIVSINANVIFYNESYITESSFKITNGTWSKIKFKLQNEIHDITGGGILTGRSGANLHAVWDTWYTVGYWYDTNTGIVVGDPIILSSWMVCVSGCEDNQNPDDPFGEYLIQGNLPGILPLQTIEDDITLSSIANGRMPVSPLLVSWQAHVKAVFDPNTQLWLSVIGSPPFPVPVSQPFIDDYGDPGVLFCRVGTWSFSYYVLNFKSIHVSFNFVSIYDYVYGTGTTTRTFDDGLSKVFWAN